MAILSPDQLKNLASKPKHKAALEKALKHELRLRMHTEPIMQKSEYTQAHKDFLYWVNSLLTAEDKQKRFAQMMTLPLGTTSLCNNIYLEFPRALDAYNKYIKNSFTTEEAETDFKQYCDEIGFNDFWKGTGMDALKKYINAFIIVDLPQDQAGSRPNPYMYLLHLDHVLDVEMKPDGTCEYIIFCQDVSYKDDQGGIAKRIAAFDDANMRTFIKMKESDIWVPEKDIPHALGICPAFKFYPELISKNNPLDSTSPISEALGDLDLLLFDKVGAEYYKTYGKFPIYWGYKQDCSYKDAVTGGECDGNGQVTWYEVEGVNNKPHFKECPKCAAKKLFGPGTFIEVDPPRMKEEADLRDPIGFLGVDSDALEFIRSEIKAKEAAILYNTTGNIAEGSLSKEALNEIQVKSTFEARKNVLMSIKNNLEKSIYWAYYMLAKFRYGPQYLGSTVDLGSEFFLRTVEELNKDYEETKKAGRPSYELASKREFIYLTAYHNNPEELNKLDILQNIEPYQDLGIQEVKNMGIPLSDPVGYIIKLNFYTFVKRFERENLPLLQFGSALSFQSKIDAITETLKIYANEQLQEANSSGNPFAPKIDNPEGSAGQ